MKSKILKRIGIAVGIILFVIGFFYVFSDLIKESPSSSALTENDKVNMVRYTGNFDGYIAVIEEKTRKGQREELTVNILKDTYDVNFTETGFRKIMVISSYPNFRCLYSYDDKENYDFSQQYNGDGKECKNFTDEDIRNAFKLKAKAFVEIYPKK